MPLVRPSAYHHVQDVPADPWVIVHNLGGAGGTVPMVDAMIDVDGVPTKIIPVSITVIDESTIQIDFSAPRTGTATILV